MYYMKNYIKFIKFYKWLLNQYNEQLYLFCIRKIFFLYSLLSEVFNQSNFFEILMILNEHIDKD